MSASPRRPGLRRSATLRLNEALAHEIDQQEITARRATASSPRRAASSLSSQQPKPELIAARFKLASDGIINTTNLIPTPKHAPCIPFHTFRLLRERKSDENGELTHLETFLDQIFPISIW